MNYQPNISNLERQMLAVSGEELAKGTIIRMPQKQQPGYWVGCPGVFYAADQKAWYITYRIRRPRGVEHDRGAETRIARSLNLKDWTDILTVTKDQYKSTSIEKSHLYKGKDTIWRYFTSFVGADGKWGVSKICASDPSLLKPESHSVIFSAKGLGVEGVKDPWVFQKQGVYYMLLSVALPVKSTSGQSHTTNDIFNTGQCLSASGIATSVDLDHWEWKGVVLQPPEAGWDQYCRRMNSVVQIGQRWVAFYDGIASEKQNYQEKCGFAQSTDLLTWKSLTIEKPAISGPFSTQSIRYLDVKILDEQMHIFYQFAREDGSHDLRYYKTAMK